MSSELLKSILLNLKTLNFHVDLLYDMIMGTMWGLVLIVLTLNFLNYVTPHSFLLPSDSDVVEIISISLPILLLLNVAVLTFSNIYLENTSAHTALTLKVTGSQWLWTYEMADYGVEVESFLSPMSEMSLGVPSLLTSSNPCVLPFGVPTLLKLTSTDVLHAWTIPSLSIKSDCVPGTSFSITTTISLPGVYYGMCSELCGSMHPFMPIHVEATSPLLFLSWVQTLNQ